MNYALALTTAASVLYAAARLNGSTVASAAHLAALALLAGVAISA